MTNQKLVDYIKSNMSQGHSPDEITNHLLKQGNEREEINDAMSTIQHEIIQKRINEIRNKPNGFMLLMGVLSLIPLFILSLSFVYSKFIEQVSTSLIFINFMLILTLIIVSLFDAYLVFFEVSIKRKSFLWVLLPLFLGGVGLLIYYFLNTPKQTSS